MSETSATDLADAEQDCGLTLSGKVMDHDTRQPLVGATILIVEQNKATMTDEYGNYHFHHLCRGNYTLKITYIGYEEERISFRMSTSTVRNLTLHTDARMLHSVEITGSRMTEQPQASETLSGRELAETRGLSLGESLKRLSGVSSIQTGPNVSKPVIHGLFGSRVLILNNGVRHEAQQWGDEHAPEIDPLNADEMKVVKGAAGVRYGSDAIGGIVLVNPRPLPDSTGLNGEVNLIGSTNNRMGAASAMLEGKLAKLPPLSWRVHTSAKKAGSASTPDYVLKNTGFEEQNLSATLAYRQPRFGSEVYYSYFHSKLGVLSSAHIGSPADLFNAIQRKQPEETGDFSYAIERPYQDVTHHLLKTKAYYQTGDLGQLQLTYAYQQNIRDEYDKHRPRADGQAELHLDLATHSTDLAWEHKPVGNFSGSIGVGTLWQNNTYKNRYFIPFFRNFTSGVFWTEKWRKGNLQLEAGARYDHKDLQIRKRENDSTVIRPEYAFHNLSGSFGAMYDLGYHLTLSGNLSYASRAPHANELFAEGVHHGTATYEQGDPNLKSEHATNAVATVNYHSNRRLNGEVSVYRNFIQDYIYLQPTGEVIQTIRGAFPLANYQQTDATFWGVDLSLQYNFTDRFMLESKGSLVRAENSRDGSYLPFIPADRIDNSLRYQLGTMGSGRLTGTYVSLGALTVAKQHRADAQSEPFILPPDGYFLVHAEAGTTVKIGTQLLEVGITGNNLLNTTYRDYQNRLRYYADEVGRLLMFRVKIPLALLKN
nr:TonB-dependent receptor [Pontibacter ruber]